MKQSDADKIKVLKADNEHLRSTLRSIRDYPARGRYPQEIAYDEFAYKRMVDSYRDAARAGLKGKTNEQH